jgi:hydroxypyruvate isomerase
MYSMNRRDFTKSGLLAGAALGISGQSVTGQSSKDMSIPFKLNYAPGFRHFKNSAGEGPIDQLRFMHDQGFRAIEDNGMMNRPADEQSRIGKELERLGMTMGVFVAYGDFKNPTMAGNGNLNQRGRVKRDKAGIREMREKQFTEAVETAKRVNAKWCTVVPGAYDHSLEEGYQTANVVENLKLCAGIFEKHGLIMVLEPLNHRNHPGLFLTRIPQAYEICKAVDSPACKILNDLYHQQITEGNLIPNIDRAWDEIAYFQVGDNPGRNEPGTGEINYRNIFRHLHGKGYTGIIGMEHGISIKGAAGERRLIEAYREVDAFEV